MGFLVARGNPDHAVVRWEIETVARMRRVGAHPSFEPALVAFNLVLARMANELAADTAGKPAPFPSVETSINQVLRPLAKGAEEAGLGKVYASEAEYVAALLRWARTGDMGGDAAEPESAPPPAPPKLRPAHLALVPPPAPEPVPMTAAAPAPPPASVPPPAPPVAPEEDFVRW